PAVDLIPIRIVDVVVQSARLLAHLSAGNDQLGYGGDVAQFDQVRGHVEVPVVFLDLVLDQLDAAHGPRQALVRAYDTDVVPHGAADLIPVLGYDDHLIAVGGGARVPMWYLSLIALQCLQHTG